MNKASRRVGRTDGRTIEWRLPCTGRAPTVNGGHGRIDEGQLCRVSAISRQVARMPARSRPWRPTVGPTPNQSTQYSPPVSPPTADVSYKRQPLKTLLNTIPRNRLHECIFGFRTFVNECRRASQ